MIRMFVLVFLSLFIHGCGRIDPSDFKIIGGQPAKEHTPWLVQLLDDATSGQGFCGGTLVAPRIVITAAHCLEPEFTKNLHVALGLADGINLHVNHPVKVEGIVVHHQYSPNDVKADIAILYLADYSGVQFERPVAPIDYARDEKLPESINKTAKVVGLGNTTSIGQFFDGVIREVDLPLVDIKKCRDAYNDVGEKQICAGNMDHGGSDSCQGDSGGPMLARNKQGVLELVGVVSYGNGCAQKNAPGVYTRVASYLDFIESAVSDLSKPRESSNLSGELERLIKTRCTSQLGFIPFEQTSDENNKRRTVYGMDPKALKISKSDKTISGSKVDQCNFESERLKVQADWILLGSGQKTANSKVAVVITVNGTQRYVSQPQTLIYHQDSLICASSLGPVSLADQRQFTYVQFKDVIYGLGEPADQPDNNQTTWGCSIGDASIEVFELGSVGTGSRELAARIHHRSLGTISVKLLRLDQELSVMASFLFNEPTRGSLLIENLSKEDLFTWQMTCGQAFKLKLRSGGYRTAEPITNGSGYRVVIDAAQDSEGTIRGGESLTLEVEPAFDSALDSCLINDAIPVEVSQR